MNKCFQSTNIDIELLNQESYVDITSYVNARVPSGKTLYAVIPYVKTFGHNTICSVGKHDNGNIYFAYRQISSSVRTINVQLNILYF